MLHKNHQSIIAIFMLTSKSHGNSLQTQGWHTQLLLGTGWVDLRICAKFCKNFIIEHGSSWALFVRLIYRGTFNSSRRSAICGAGPAPIPSPWRARYRVQNTPPPSQNFLGLRFSSSSAVLLALRFSRFPMLVLWISFFKTTNFQVILKSINRRKKKNV